MTENDLALATSAPGWSMTRLAEVVEGAQGGFASGKKDVAGGLTHLRMNNIGEEGALVLDLLRTVPPELARDQHRLRHDDVLVCTTNSAKLVGKCAMFRLDGEFAFSNHITRLRPIRSLIDPDYLRWWLWVTWRAGAYQPLCQHWVNQSTLPKDALLSMAVALPPLAEQRRIVAKVEAVLARVDAARERLAKVPAILKRFRQSVLAAACSGRLTAGWRAANSTEACGHQQVDQVREALRRGEADDVLIERTNGRLDRLGLANGRKVSMHALPDIPDSWTWLYLPQAGYLHRGRSRNRPRGAAHLYGGPFPFVQTGDIARSSGRIVQHDQTYSNAGLEQSRLWPAGTICITIAANIANTAILTYPACFPDSVVGLVTEPALFDNRFIEFFLRTARSDLAAYAPATAQKNINIEILNEVAVPVPPRAEQTEIVLRVEKLFDLADRIEAKVGTSSMRADKLVQATLGKAFRGELVPTEAELAEREGREYESAEALLDRFHPQRPSTVRSAKPKRRPPTTDDSTFPADLFGGSNGDICATTNRNARDLDRLRSGWATLPEPVRPYEELLVQAFKAVCDRNSPDRVIADPALHRAFVAQCRKLGLESPEFDLCFSLLNLRKGSGLTGLGSARKPVRDQWRYAGASEIAARVLYWRHGLSVDRIICHPTYAGEFEAVAREIQPGQTSFEYRWAALGLRKRGQKAAQATLDRLRWSDPVALASAARLPKAGGLFAVHDGTDCLFVGETRDVAASATAQLRLAGQSFFGPDQWRLDGRRATLTYALDDGHLGDKTPSVVNALIARWCPVFNVPRAA